MIYSPSTGEFKHNLLPGYGENLAYWSSFNGHPNATHLMLWAVEEWYTKRLVVIRSFRDTTGDTGHFTQIVWKETSRLGMGISIRTPNEEHYGKNYVKTEYYITANYKKPENVQGVHRSSWSHGHRNNQECMCSANNPIRSSFQIKNKSPSKVNASHSQNK